MKKQLVFLFTLICVFLSFSACQQDEDDNLAPCGTFEVTIDGTTYTSTNTTNTIIVAVDPNSGKTTKRLDIRGNDINGGTMIITFSDQTTGGQADALNTNATYTPAEEITTGEENLFFFTFVSTNSSSISYAATSGNADLTHCDAATKRASGTFSFDAEDIDGNTIVSVTNGIFDNVCYTVL